ncbi:unnamed protein product [Microthlaspi erraticum]|uniref:Uncharacterized protein n=1 Tax=Microthlaspi erraticum TaxID=1685480 RepID=A0A6D2IIM8_9BRAS|nr:unnamed protein product [Microthlaspi erraticum]
MHWKSYIATIGPRINHLWSKCSIESSLSPTQVPPMFQEAKNPRRAAAQQNPAIGTLLHKAKNGRRTQNLKKARTPVETDPLESKKHQGRRKEGDDRTEYKMAKGITSRSHWRARRKISESTRSNRLKLHKEPQNIRLVDEIHFSTMNSLQFKRWPMEKFGRSRASKMADNPNHGIYRGHRLKSPPSSSTSHLKKKIQIGTSRIGEDRRKTFPEPI